MVKKSALLHVCEGVGENYAFRVKTTLAMMLFHDIDLSMRQHEEMMKNINIEQYFQVRSP